MLRCGHARDAQGLGGCWAECGKGIGRAPYRVRVPLIEFPGSRIQMNYPLHPASFACIVGYMKRKASPRALDLLGQRYGQLLVIARAGHVRRFAAWLCKCDCGNEVVVRSDKLRGGRKLTCGSYEKHSRWGGKTTEFRKEHNSWSHMILRCYSPTLKSYPNYGGRGITVCDRWRTSFTDFLADMGPRPGERYSIDRIDVNGNYEPGNCRWAPLSEQRRNSRDTVFVQYGDRRVKLADLADELGVKLETLRSRLVIGWPIEKAIEQPKTKPGRKPKSVVEAVPLPSAIKTGDEITRPRGAVAYGSLLKKK